MRASILGMMAAAVLLAHLGRPPAASAHCDTLDGPVVAAARQALDKGEVTPVLKWVKPEAEAELNDAFDRTLAVRHLGPQARDLADMYFFETLVRLHRAGEGAPYTGLKPAGTDLGPAVAGADKALETGSAEALVKVVTDAVAAGIRERFAEANERKKTQDESIAAGREFVEAYVIFVHYVERLYADATTAPQHSENAVSHAEGH